MAKKNIIGDNQGESLEAQEQSGFQTERLGTETTQEAATQEEIQEITQEQAGVQNEQVSAETTPLNDDTKAVVVAPVITKLLDRQEGENLDLKEQDDDSVKMDPKIAQAPEVEKKEDFIESYKRSYPNEKLFYVTSDKQVFLSGNEADAKRHQKSLKDGEIEIIKVK